MPDKPRAPATDRNRDAILAVLTDEFRSVSRVLEIGSGTGQHAVFFAERLAHLDWQTSDRRNHHAGINAWINDSPSGNVRRPLDIDVLQVEQVDGAFDAVFSANTAHIMSAHAVDKMFQLVGALLPSAGRFCLYGPFNLNGRYTSDSNQRFDESLRTQDPEMGIRDLADLDSVGAEAGLERCRLYAMPANNLLVTWTKNSAQ